MRSILHFTMIFPVLSVVLLLASCTNQPELSVKAYGTIVDELPQIDAAEGTYPFPYDDDTDHSKCVFNEEDFM